MLLRWGHIVSLYTKCSHDTCCYSEDILCNCILNYSQDTCCYDEGILCNCILNYSHDTCCHGEDILFWHEDSTTNGIINFHKDAPWPFPSVSWLSVVYFCICEVIFILPLSLVPQWNSLVPQWNRVCNNKQSWNRNDLRNQFDFWNVHGIMNTLSLTKLTWSPERLHVNFVRDPK